MRRAGSAVAALCLGVSCAPSALLADEALDVRVEASVTADNNITRSRGAGNKLGDTIYNLNVGKGGVFPLGQHTRLTLLGTAGLEAFGRHSGLSRAFLGVQGELQYRSSGEFDAPTFGIFGRAAADFYESRLRDGYRYSAGVRMLQPLTDRIEASGALACNVRDGRDSVFDNKDYSAKLNFDYAVSSRGALYLSGEYRRGQTVTTARSDPAANVIEAEVRDDAFSDVARQAYRLKAKTEIATLGYSHGLGGDQSVDLSLRWVRSTVLPQPGSVGGGETIRYYDTQVTAAYLIRF
jgi:hypothetical protein